MKKLLFIALILFLFSCSDNKSIDIAKNQIRTTFLSNDVNLLNYKVSAITDKDAYYLLEKKYNKQYENGLKDEVIIKDVSYNMLKYSKLEHDSKSLIKMKKVDFSKILAKDTINKGFVIIDQNGKYLDFEITK